MNEPDKHPGIPSESPSPRPRRRRWPYVLLGLVLVLFAVVAAAPAVISSAPVRNALLDRVNQSVPGSVSVDEFSLSWLGGQSVRGLAVSDEGGTPVLSLAEFSTELSLLDALLARLSLGETVLRGLDANLEFLADGTTNLAAALGAQPGAPEERAGGGVLAPVTGNMTLSDSRIVIAALGIDPVLLENLSGEIAMAGFDRPVSIRFSGDSRQGELQGSIAIDGQIDDLFVNGEISPATAKTNFNATIEDLPVDALDQLLDSKGVLTAALGNKTSISLKAGGDATRQDISVTAGSPNAGVSLEGVIADNWFKLKSPAVARVEVTPALMEAAHRLAENDSGMALAATVPVHLTIQQLDVPLENPNPSGIAIDALLEAKKPIRLTGIEQLGEVAVDDLRMKVSSAKLADGIKLSLNGKPTTQGKAGALALDASVDRLLDESGALQLNAATVQASSSISGIPTALLDTVMQQGGLLTDAMGPTLGVKLDAATDENRNTRVTLELDAARIKTSPMKFAVSDSIALTEPAELRLAVTPELVRRFTGNDGAYQLAETSNWTIALSSFEAPMPVDGAPAFQPGRTRVEATLSSPALLAADTQTGQATRIENLSLGVAGETLADLNIDGALTLMQKQGVLANLDASPLEAKFSGRTGVADDASLKTLTSSIELASSGLNARLNSTLEQGFKKLVLNEPGTFDAALTPALLASWQDSEGPKATLSQATRIKGKLNKLEVPLAPFGYAGMIAEGEAGADSLGIASPGGAVTTVDKLRTAFGFEGKDGTKLKLNLDGAVRSGGDGDGTLSLAATASNLLNADGEMSSDAMSLELDGNLQQLPVALVDQLLNMDGLVTATLGGTADFELSTRLEKMRGPVSISLKAPNTQADIKAQLRQEGIVLNEPLVAQVQPTPEFGKKVLSKVHPIFETTQRAEQPIRFEMPAEGVLIPIEDYDFSKVKIPSMKVDFGKLVLKSGWLLRGIVGLGQQFGELDDVQREEWVAWFTPGVLEVNNGQVLYTRRVDLLLAEKLHLATWGRADVSRDQSNLVLAFMPDTMKRVFSITVAEHDALHVPIQGPLSGPSVDFKKTATDLARLRAQEEVAEKEPLAGILLGAASDKLTGIDTNMPPASVTPLPWAEQLKAQDAAEAEAERQRAAQQQANQPQQQQPATQQREESTEEKVIKGLIDLFGNKKKE